MDVLPLPFGLGLALLSRTQAERLGKTKAVRPQRGASAEPDLNRAETRYSAFRQVV
jgi:hypothetical protein